jgi:hypothetical protein
MFPVRYELNVIYYIQKNSVLKWLYLINASDSI